MQEYQLGDEIECQYTITNNHNNEYHVLKRFTPLEGIISSFVSITRNGEVIPYDGIIIRRHFQPQHKEYLMLNAGSTQDSTIELSLAYAMNQTGQYTVTVKIPLYYHHPLHCDTFKDTAQAFESTVLTFQIHEGRSSRLTLGEFQRQKERATPRVSVQQVGYPLDPNIVGGTEDQKLLTKEIHRASYHYVCAASDDIDDNRPHYVSWFGAEDAGRIQKVKTTYQEIKTAMENDVITYYLDDPKCSPNVYAFTYKNSREIYLCNLYDQAEPICGIDTKLCTIVHKLSHCVSLTDMVGKAA